MNKIAATIATSCVLGFGSASSATPLHYDLYFAAPPTHVGDTFHPLNFGLTGGFDYDAATAQFSNFALVFTHTGQVTDPADPSSLLTITQVDTFDLTSYANSPPFVSADLNPGDLGLTGTSADNFTLLKMSLPLSQSSPPYSLNGYFAGAHREPGLGSILGQGSISLEALYCGASCGGVVLGSDGEVATGFTTTATHGASNPFLMLTWTNDFAWSLSPITTGPYFDIPEPGTWLFMLLGCGAVGGALRRRRARKTCVVANGG